MPIHNGTEWKTEKAWWVKVSGTWQKSTNIWKKVAGVWEKMSLLVAGVVTTLAGSGSTGDTDATGTAASFNRPFDNSSNSTHVFVADTNNHKIRQIEISTGVVTTLAGSGTSGDTDGTGTAASFYNPYGVSATSTHVFVADTNNHKIRQIEINTGVVTTLAGSGSTGDTDATGTAASFYNPFGVSATSTHVFVADTNNHKIRQIEISTGVVTTLAGSGTAGDTDATGTAASFDSPSALSTTGTHVFVADRENNKIRQIEISTGVVTTLAGSGTAGDTDATGAAASFYDPLGVSSNSTHVFVADLNNRKIRQIEISTGVVTTLAGSGTPGSSDGTGAAASFQSPTGVYSNSSHVFVADYGNNKIRQITLE